MVDGGGAQLNPPSEPPGGSCGFSNKLRLSMHLIQIIPLGGKSSEGATTTRRAPDQMEGLPPSDLFFCGLHEQWS